MRSKIFAGVATVVVGFLLVTNPVVVDAAGQIGSAQIKNNAVKSVDLKNNNIKSVDIKNGQVKLPDLQGSAADALKTKTYEYTLPVEAAATLQTYSFGALPPGTYLTSLHAIFDTAAIGNAVLCFLRTGGTVSEAVMYGSPAQFGPYSSVAATAVLDIPISVTMTCNTQNGTDTWAVRATALDPSTVSFTRVDNVVSSAATRGVKRGGSAATN